jgi:hypothetical protein
MDTNRNEVSIFAHYVSLPWVGYTPMKAEAKQALFREIQLIKA